MRCKPATPVYHPNHKYHSSLSRLYGVRSSDGLSLKGFLSQLPFISLPKTL